MAICHVRFCVVITKEQTGKKGKVQKKRCRISSDAVYMMIDCIFFCTFYQGNLERASKSSTSKVTQFKFKHQSTKGDPLDVEVTSRKETKAFLGPDQIMKTMEEFPN